MLFLLLVNSVKEENLNYYLFSVMESKHFLQMTLDLVIEALYEP